MPFVYCDDARFVDAAIASYLKHCGPNARSAAEGDLLGEALAALAALYDPISGPCRAVNPGQFEVHDRALAVLAKARGKVAP